MSFDQEYNWPHFCDDDFWPSCQATKRQVKNAIREVTWLSTDVLEAKAVTDDTSLRYRSYIEWWHFLINRKLVTLLDPPLRIFYDLPTFSILRPRPFLSVPGKCRWVPPRPPPFLLTRPQQATPSVIPAQAPPLFFFSFVNNRMIKLRYNLAPVKDETHCK